MKIVGGSVAALALPTALLWLLSRAGLLSLDDVIDLSLSTEFIVTCVIVAIVMVVVSRRHRPPADAVAANASDFENNYSAADQAVHRIAFATRPTQIGLSNLEDRLYAGRLAKVRTERPVFVTALPRAGTTLLLEMLDSVPELCAHTYRDMPMILTPLMWSRFSSGFKKTDTARERAHGDGMMVSYESPEAFEEVLWATFWPDQYRPDAVTPWNPKFRHAKFEAFFANHMRKIVALRNGESGRYLSKNNMNIARLAYLARRFPDATVIVCFREPLQHAASLLKQHLNFLKIHKEDDFARRYMRAIGHYDFGANLKPIDFDGWLAATTSPQTTTLEFWLHYWFNCYANLLEQRSRQIHLFSYDALCAKPHVSLNRLSTVVQPHDGEALVGAAGRISTPPIHQIDDTRLPADLVMRCRDLHARLLAQALDRQESP